ncbi:hypothetical protein S7711_11612, partial [Stachybotrys chartarum IBT 7711]
FIIIISIAPCCITRAATRAAAQPDPTTPAPSGRKRLAGLRAKRNMKPMARKSAAGGPPRNRTSGTGAALKEKEIIIMTVSEGEETKISNPISDISSDFQNSATTIDI